jgi:hypothetical protein
VVGTCLLRCSRVAVAGVRGGWAGGVHSAMVLAHCRALSLSVIPGNRRRTSIAADSSPSCSKAARIAAASASVTMNIVVRMGTSGARGKRLWLSRYLVTATTP